MPPARNTLKTSFDEASDFVSNIRRSEIILWFDYRNTNDEMISVNYCKASSLYKDWYDDCSRCPSNDTLISNLRIHVNPTCTTVAVTHEVMFEHLMNMLENTANGHSYCGHKSRNNPYHKAILQKIT